MKARGVVLLWMCGVAAASGAFGASDAPRFVTPPAAKLEGEHVRITFQVDRPTDVAVAIVDETGAVVRHLAAGLLGKAAPEPLQKDSLEQSLDWDGKNDAGRPVKPGACRVKVGLGLEARFERLIEWEPPRLFSRGVVGMATDERGAIYALQGPMWHGRGGATELTVWNRAGRYRRSLMPFRRDVPLDRLPGVTFRTLPSGQKVPGGIMFPGPTGSRNIMLMRDGRITMVGHGRLVRCMAADGSAPPEGHLGPALPGKTGKRLPVYLAFSPDGKVVYVSGLGEKDGPGFANRVFRARWKDPAAVPFAGVEPTPGGKTAVVKAVFDGRIAEVCVAPGQIVPEKTRLALMDTDALQAQLKAAEAERATLRNRLAVALRSGDPEAAKATRAKAMAAAVRIALLELQIKQAALLAPVAGQVTPRVARAGEPVKKGDVLFEVVPVRKVLSDPRGIAAAPDGRLAICDFNHDRIVVCSADGKLLKTMDVVGPEQVVIHPGTGAAYVLVVRDNIKRTSGKSLMYKDKAVVKYAGLDDWKPVARIELPKRGRHLHDAGPILVLDAAASPPIVYVSYAGRQEAGDHLWKLVDRGDRLEHVSPPVPRYHWPFGRSFVGVTIDREREQLYLGGRSFPGLLRVDGRTGKITELTKITRDLVGKARLATDHPQVTGMAVDPHGRLVLRLMGTWSSRDNWIRRYDRGGNRVPFPKAKPPKDSGRIQWTPHESPAKSGPEFVVTQPSRGYHSGGLAITANGDIYVVEKAVDPKTGRFRPGNANSLNVYSADGELKKKGLIPWLSAGAWGPRLDAAGNLYLTDALRPNKPTARSMHTGSLVRYGPTGGKVVMDAGKDAPYVTRRNERDLPPTKLEGAHWVRYGVGLVPFGHCVCSSCPFDLDGFGRSFVIDKNRYRVIVVDSGGNFVSTFGEYGNRDSRGPKSAVPVPKIPFGEPSALAVSDRAVYVYDRRNHRVVVARLTCATEKTCEVKTAP